MNAKRKTKLDLDLDDLKRRAGLRPYRSRLGPLRREGRGWVAGCLWHEDRHPSLHIFEKRGAWLFKCFPCAEAGDIFDLVQKVDGVDFAEAVRRVRAEVGQGDRSTKEGTGMNVAADWGGAGASFNFDRAKAAAQIDRAANYLASRGISLDLARNVGLGYIPDYPGIGPMIAIPYGDEPVKLRALAPADKTKKFRHIKGHASADCLYGIEQLEADVFPPSGEVWVVESELDSLTVRAHGLTAVSVSSATTCIGPDGRLKIKPEHRALLDRAERIFVATDMDEAGSKCAAAFALEFPSYKLFRVSWPYTKGGSDPKDIGEVYAVTQPNFSGALAHLRAQALDRPPDWRKLFKTRGEMESGPIRFLIDRFLPEGVCFLGGLSAAGKTWFALSMAKALTTGKKFLGNFVVPTPVNVLYLVPESGERAFRNRLETMGIDERLLCRTMMDGVLKLDDPLLLAAVRDLKPVVVLDTAVRFADVENENSSAEHARGPAKVIFGLIAAGAQAVVGLHHSPKDAADRPHLTLETALRGTGDIGAMSDVVYALRCLDQGSLTVQVECVKARDFEPLKPFEIAGRPFIDERGDFVMVAEPEPSLIETEVEILGRAIADNPRATYEELSKATGFASGRIAKIAAKAGWQKKRNQPWKRAGDGPTLDLQAA